MRTDQDARLPDARVRGLSDCAHPPVDEVGLVRRNELRRAEIQEERLVGRQADFSAELLARGAGATREPLVVDRRPGGVRLFGTNAVHRDRLPPLDLLPGLDPVGGDAVAAYA